MAAIKANLRVILGSSFIVLILVLIIAYWSQLTDKTHVNYEEQALGLH
ncbi:hypothetical protein HZA55_10040 [Candidatus Poribacteria bacterium]|nr:hypothetical protein [Candidatus Poribacteria bacterium]